MNGGLALRSLSPVTLLDRTEFFDALSRLQLEKVADICQLKHYNPHCDIYRHGDEAEDLYVLVDGTVMVAVGFGERNASAGNTLRRGSVFGWAALTPTANHRIATASCITPCTVLSIDGKALIALMEQDHTLGYLLMKQINLLITGTLLAFAAG